jgi:hypothetical protein
MDRYSTILGLVRAARKKPESLAFERKFLEKNRAELGITAESPAAMELVKKYANVPDDSAAAWQPEDLPGFSSDKEQDDGTNEDE